VRKLTETGDASHAEALSALLEVNQVQNEVRTSESGFTVWVRLDDDVPRARELLETFDPAAAAALIGQAEKVRRKREKKRRPTGVVRQGVAMGNTPLGAGVAVLIAISVLVAVIYRLDYAPPLGIVPPDPTGRFFSREFDWSQPWRLFTPMFIHFGLFHIVFNMLWLRRLGGQIEANHGTVRLVLFVLGSAAISNWAQYELSGPRFGGMSGVNYALFGFGWMYTRFGPPGGYSVTRTDAAWMVGWLVLCATGMIGPIANGAHAMGLVCGIAGGLPAYINFRRTFRVKTKFEKGSWEDLNITGWRRFQRLVVEPYLPGWMLLLALVVLWLDY
jgi:GlpG protein